MMELSVSQHDDEIEISGKQARGGSQITGRVLSVLIVSTVLAVVAMAIVYIVMRR